MGQERRLTVAITGASGSIYAVRFLEAVLGRYDRIYLTVTENAKEVIGQELGLPVGCMDAETLLGGSHPKIEMLDPRDISAPPASGSVVTEGMVIVPCSMGSLGRIASGISNDLVTRAADVCLKERRKLIMVVRETPYSLIHLRSMTLLTEAGAVILPASPAFYSNPKSIEDMVSFVVGRMLQQLGIPQTLTPEWSPESKTI